MANVKYKRVFLEHRDSTQCPAKCNVCCFHREGAGCGRTKEHDEAPFCATPDESGGGTTYYLIKLDESEES